LLFKRDHVPKHGCHLGRKLLRVDRGENISELPIKQLRCIGKILPEGGTPIAKRFRFPLYS
jgi:hypothetical protein